MNHVLDIRQGSAFVAFEHQKDRVLEISYRIIRSKPDYLVQIG